MTVILPIPSLDLHSGLREYCQPQYSIPSSYSFLSEKEFYN